MEPWAHFDYDVNIYRSLTSVDRSRSYWLEPMRFLAHPKTARNFSGLQIACWNPVGTFVLRSPTGSQGTQIQAWDRDSCNPLLSLPLYLTLHPEQVIHSRQICPPQTLLPRAVLLRSTLPKPIFLCSILLRSVQFKPCLFLQKLRC